MVPVVPWPESADYRLANAGRLRAGSGTQIRIEPAPPVAPPLNVQPALGERTDKVVLYDHDDDDDDACRKHIYRHAPGADTRLTFSRRDNVRSYIYIM